MGELKTDEGLLRALQRAASQDLTADEVRRQRISFVVGSLKDSNTVSKERVRSVLDKQEGNTKN